MIFEKNLPWGSVLKFSQCRRQLSPVDMLEHRDTYGQAQVCSKSYQGSSVDRPCQPSFCWIKFWHVRNPLPQSIRLRLSVLVRYWAGQGE